MHISAPDRNQTGSLESLPNALPLLAWPWAPGVKDAQASRGSAFGKDSRLPVWFLSGAEICMLLAYM